MTSMYTKEAISEFHTLLDYYKIKSEVEVKKIFDVFYLYFKLDNEDDLYITKYGLPIFRNLFPYNFLTDDNWFKKNSIRLWGSSCTYKVKTKEIDGKQRDVVVKYNRMGQEIPGADETEELSSAVFNSPFEEFSLVMELRDTKYESHGKIVTQKPLAIYVPSERAELWRMGRNKSIMQAKLEVHKDIELDMFRSYVMIYEWIKGIDAAHACRMGFLDDNEMIVLTLRVEKEMKNKGFTVKDRKPHHIIIRPQEDSSLARNKQENLLYAVIDYELLERTGERETNIKRTKRVNYLVKQKNRFVLSSSKYFPPHLKHVNIFGVHYIFGHAESTKGILWVLGKDPDLFDYFLPERWGNTPRTKLSSHHEIYYTLTKDNIHLVWKVSKVGTQPDMDPYREDERKILEHGFNSPFEEISFAIELSEKGIRTVYPRAVYMFGNKIVISDSISDNSRYESHKRYLTPDGNPILRKDYKYIIIWGYWNGPDEKLAAKDGDYLEGISALNAYRKDMISRDEYIQLLRRKEERLKKVGFEDLHLRGSHVLLSLDSIGNLLKDYEGIPEMRICNFELLKKIP
ncbi:MAG: hypothetical protein AMS17_08700 [Spirochaetes bacterium DG_61]|nr:MAG: hypothetical protein AMS17_08700 [Spirochaetes bacterium DG_61]